MIVGAAKDLHLAETDLDPLMLLKYSHSISLIRELLVGFL